MAYRLDSIPTSVEREGCSGARAARAAGRRRRHRWSSACRRSDCWLGLSAGPKTRVAGGGAGDPRRCRAGEGSAGRTRRHGSPRSGQAAFSIRQRRTTRKSSSCCRRRKRRCRGRHRRRRTANSPRRPMRRHAASAVRPGAATAARAGAAVQAAARPPPQPPPSAAALPPAPPPPPAHQPSPTPPSAGTAGARDRSAARRGYAATLGRGARRNGERLNEARQPDLLGSSLHHRGARRSRRHAASSTASWPGRSPMPPRPSGLQRRLSSRNVGCILVKP